MEGYWKSREREVTREQHVKVDASARGSPYMERLLPGYKKISSGKPQNAFDPFINDG